MRINRPLALAVPDIQAAVGAPCEAISITKVDGPSHVRLLDELVAECERRADVPHGPGASCCWWKPRPPSRPCASSSALHPAWWPEPGQRGLRTGLRFGAGRRHAPHAQAADGDRRPGSRRAADRHLGQRRPASDDTEAFRAMVRRSRRFGFEAATCVHPAQVAIVNEEYGVTAEALLLRSGWSTRTSVTRAQDVAPSELDGQMVDEPIVERARRVLLRHASRPRRRLKPESFLRIHCPLTRQAQPLEPANGSRGRRVAAQVGGELAPRRHHQRQALGILRPVEAVQRHAQRDGADQPLARCRTPGRRWPRFLIALGERHRIVRRADVVERLARLRSGEGQQHLAGGALCQLDPVAFAARSCARCAAARPGAGRPVDRLRAHRSPPSRGSALVSSRSTGST